MVAARRQTSHSDIGGTKVCALLVSEYKSNSGAVTSMARRYSLYTGLDRVHGEIRETSGAAAARLRVPRDRGDR